MMRRPCRIDLAGMPTGAHSKVLTGVLSRALTGVLIGSLVLTGCSSAPSPDTNSAESDVPAPIEQSGDVLDGEWEVNTEVVARTVPEEQESIFRDAILGVLDVNYEPVALLGQQVVAGMNYAYLCQAIYWEDEATPVWSIVTVYHDLEGNATLTEDKTIDVANVRTAEATADLATTGAWEVPNPNNGMILPEDAQQVFNKAMETYDGVSVSPIVLLGTQVVAGTNYRVLAQGASQGATSAQAIYVLDIYEDPAGTCSVTSHAPLDLAYYVSE